jgi:hypothetical protein
MQLYVIKFVSDLRQVGGFLQELRFPPPIKLMPRYNWNIVEVELNFINHKPIFRLKIFVAVLWFG